MFLGLVVHSNAQSQDTLQELKFLNLNGQFIRKNGMYQDTAGNQYGIKLRRVCNVFTTSYAGRIVISKSSTIADYNEPNNTILLFYDDQIRYVKFRKGNFIKFIEENTANGNLKPPSELKYKGKDLKVYCTRDAKTNRLSDRCN